MHYKLFVIFHMINLKTNWTSNKCRHWYFTVTPTSYVFWIYQRVIWEQLIWRSRHEISVTFLISPNLFLAYYKNLVWSHSPGLKVGLVSILAPKFAPNKFFAWPQKLVCPEIWPLIKNCLVSNLKVLSSNFRFMMDYSVIGSY